MIKISKTNRTLAADKYNYSRKVNRNQANNKKKEKKKEKKKKKTAAEKETQFNSKRLFSSLFIGEPCIHYIKLKYVKVGFI